MSKEAMKLALEALEKALRYHGVMLLSDPPQDAWKYHRVEQAAHEAITALREALAEQPAQQEPVACQYAQDVAMPEYRCIGRCQYDTSPPAQRTWVGLTDADKQEAFDETQEASGGFWEFADYLEAKLKEKNT